QYLDKAGNEQYASIDFPANSWCPTTIWKPGQVVRLRSTMLYIGTVPTGIAHVAIALLPHAVPFSSTMARQDRPPVQVVQTPDTVTLVKGTKALQLATFSIR